MILLKVKLYLILINKIIATGFGVGYIKYAPGTFGTLVAIPCYLLIRNLTINNYLLLIIVGFLIGILICECAAKDFGIHDYKAIVWDEIIGYLITMTAIPNSYIWIINGFIIFRIFDIFKPWPISYVDQCIKGGLGIMLDDCLAACYAWIVLKSIQFFII